MTRHLREIHLGSHFKKLSEEKQEMIEQERSTDTVEEYIQEQRLETYDRDHINALLQDNLLMNYNSNLTRRKNIIRRSKGL